MTIINSVAKTYSDDLQHDGYFIVTNNYRMKWASKWTWENIKAQPLMKLTIDKWIQRLEDAQ